MEKLPLLYGIYGGDDPNFFYKIERSFLGGVGIFQLREKEKSKREIIEKAKRIKKICDAYNVLLIINDDPEIALEVNAHGVHIGKKDGDIRKIRKIIKNKILGVSCYDDISRAEKAEKEGADYVSFSSPFPSPTKKDKKIVPFEVIEKAIEKINIPLFVIGGINSENVSYLLSRIKCGICSISGIYHSQDPFLNTFKMREKILYHNEGSLTF